MNSSYFFSLFYLLIISLIPNSFGLSSSEISSLRQRVLEVFDYAFTNYKEHAFPHDSLKPITGKWCDNWSELGNSKKFNSPDYNGIALSLIESLSTFAVMGKVQQFSEGVNYLIQTLNFNVDLRVHVFETNIRLLGGLLSAHLLALDPEFDLIYNYDGELLLHAYELGKRLLPSFDTKTGIPYAWVNLKFGVKPNETLHTCTAAVGTLLLEFGLLSYLTKDDRFYINAYHALKTLWSLRSPINLLGNTLNINPAHWVNPNSDIGAGIDSFFEYLLKSSIFFHHHEFWDMYSVSLNAIEKYLHMDPWYIQAHMFSGKASHIQFNSLQCFWPGLQGISGHLSSAQKTYQAFLSLYQKYSAIPEMYLLNTQQIHPTEKYYPLRPEFIESTYHLYRITRDHQYLEIGQKILENIINISKVEYGFASIKDVTTKKLEDRMPSFFLSETLKYLFLLFDPNNWIHQREMDYIFTTEGHIFPLDIDIFEYISTLHNRMRHYYPTNHTRPACPIIPLTDWRSYLQPADKSDSTYKTCPLSSTSTILKSHRYNINEDFEVTFAEQTFTTWQKSTGEIVSISGLGGIHHEVIRSSSYNYEGALLSIYPHKSSLVQFQLQVPYCSLNLSTFPSLFGPDLIYNTFFILETVTPREACRIQKDPNLKEKAVVVSRGHCTFVEKATQLTYSNTQIMIVINSNNNPPFFMMGHDGSNRNVTIPSIMIDHFGGEKLLNCISKYHKQPIMVSIQKETVDWVNLNHSTRQINITSISGWVMQIYKRGLYYYIAVS